MKIKTMKTKAAATAFFLALTIVITFAASPTANAQSTKATYAFVGAMPNPVGVGQEVLIHLGIPDAHPSGAAYGWEGLTVTVTRPDGKTETLGPLKTDSTGGTGTNYVPTMAGNYTPNENVRDCAPFVDEAITMKLITS